MPVFPAVRSRFLGAQLQRPATYEASLRGAPGGLLGASSLASAGPAPRKYAVFTRQGLSSYRQFYL